MSGITIFTRSSPMPRSNQTNSTTVGTSIANPADTQVKPSGDGVIDLGADRGGYVPNGLLIIPYGTDTSAQTFLLSAFAWDMIPAGTGAAGDKDTWQAYLLASFQCTLCTLTGLALSPVNASQLYCGTITITAGNANVSAEAVSPTGNIKASILLDTKGAALVELRFARNGSAASMNSIYRKV